MLGCAVIKQQILYRIPGTLRNFTAGFGFCKVVQETAEICHPQQAFRELFGNYPGNMGGCLEASTGAVELDSGTQGISHIQTDQDSSATVFHRLPKRISSLHVRVLC
jgi:hypothetical protein